MTNTDLSAAFRLAHSATRSWSVGDVAEALQRVAGAVSGYAVDWEPGDENWGRVIDGGIVVALVCARLPLGLAHDDVPAGALSENISWLRFRSLEDRGYQVDRRLLEDVFDRRLSENINYAALTLGELWWATVS